MTKKKKLRLLWDVLFLALLIAGDQVSKYFAVLYLKDRPAFPIVDGVLELNYLENRGAAFGMLQNQVAFFIFIGVVILGLIGYVLVKAPDDRKYTALHLLLTMVAGGALGNMIDRLRHDYVVDFIYFVAINFPIFNVADIYVTTAAAVLVIFFLFVYKEKDLAFLNFKQTKYREIK